MKKTAFWRIAGFLHSRNLKQDILSATIIFVLIYLVLGSAIGVEGDPVDCIANGDFSSGTGSSALNWTQSSDGNAATDWISGTGIMRMQVSGSSESSNGYCNQSFDFNSKADSAVLNFSWKFEQKNGEGNFSVELKDPFENIDTIWSNSSSSEVDWTDENVNITNYMNETGTYNLSLHAYLITGSGSSSACMKWDNVSLITQHGGSNDTSTAPTIYNVTNSTPTDTQVYIIWDTDQPDSNNRVRYSLTPDLTNSSWSSWANNTGSVNLSLTDLESSISYYYSAYSSNGTNCSYHSNSSIHNFTTASSDTNTAPSIYNVTNSTPTDTQVYIIWDTDQPDSNNRVRYSLNSDLTNSSWSGWDNNTGSVNLSLTDLESSISYYYFAYSSNGTNCSYHSNSSIPNFTTAAGGPPPAIRSHWNNKTDDSLDLQVNITEPVEFGVTFNQTGNITWDATGHPLRFNDPADSANQTFSWNTHGIKHLNVSMENNNGTSEMLTWNIMVTSPPIYVNETGWWFEDGQFIQSNTPIQSAVDNATGGSYIFVYNGSYTEDVVINKPLKLEGEGRDVVDVSAKTYGNVISIESSWVDISGFTIKGSINSGIYLYESDHCNISWNNISSNLYYGIYLIKSNYNNISNNIVKDNHRDGYSGGKAIYIYDHSEHNTITDNTIEHNIYGLFIDSGSGNNTVHTNVVKDNQNGVYVTTRYNLLYNNYILFNKEYDARDTTGDNRWNITKTPGINILNGSHLGGNYYGEYTGCDADDDGLGDTPYIISDEDTKDYLPLVSSIRILERWNSKTQNNLTLTANLNEEIDFRIKYNQIGEIRWRDGDEFREDLLCSEANQTYSWNEPGTKYVDVWLTNGNGTSNKTEWVVSMNTNIRGQVRDDSSNPLISDITYYDTDGETVLANNTTSSTFNFTGVPLYGYLEIDAFSTKNASTRFCTSGTSGNAVITIDETKENPASFEVSGIPIKYIKVQPTSLAYNSCTLKIRYSDDELNGVSEGALSIYRMEGNSWNKLPTQRDTVNNILTASPSSPGWFAVACPAGIGVCTQLLISTEKATYLLDPYYWVYEAPDSLWPSDGYNRTVNFTILLMDHKGYRVAVDEVHYNVSNSSTVIASGDAYDRGDGLYTASFNITDADAGGINFKGSVPESITIHVEASSYDSIIDGSKSFGVGRWGCDRCHIEQSLAESVYDWCNPSGSDNAHYSWENILGETDDQFDLSYLTNSELTHTPREYLHTDPWHEETKSKMSGSSGSSGSSECSPCHQGSGEVRDNDSTVVECTFCHGTDGGHNTTYWPDSAGYAYGEHTKVDPPSATGLAEQSCSNSSCHGHISNSDQGDIDNAYPDCSSCHPLSFGSGVPQWMDASTGEPRDMGGHPNDESVVNCSFCHNSFHSLFDENDVLTCDDCHPKSNDYPVHPYEGYPGTNTATCANCHCDADHLNIHNISIPGCKDCHSDVYMDINVNYNSYAMDDDPDNLAPSGSNMTHKRDTRVALHWGTDPQGLSVNGSSGVFYSRHACPESSGGWPDATGPERNGDQICINCHSKIVRDAGAWHDENWKRDNYYSCKPCHNLWSDDAIYGSPNVHYLSASHCTDCHSATLPDPWHGTWNSSPIPKDYMRTPVIGLMLEDNIHGRLVLNTTTGKPSNHLGCLICHTDVDFNIIYDDFKITITDYSGAHAWNSKPDCTKCHSIDPAVERPGPYPHAHDILNMDWGNNTQCLKCHNIYNQTAGRYHGHDASNSESCTGCHFDYQAMDDYGKPSVYVNEEMYADSVHGTTPGENCAQCHTKYHPPPEYAWKWCECCHSYQSEPVADTNRHNITDAPSNYMIGGVSVLEITDCTACHDATLYSNSKNTFNRSSGKDCRYCHTYPDQTYY